MHNEKNMIWHKIMFFDGLAQLMFYSHKYFKNLKCDRMVLDCKEEDTFFFECC